MTSPIAVVTSAINIVVRPRTKLPKPVRPKAGNLHECMDDGHLVLDQLHKDAELLTARRRTVRLFVICNAIDERSRRHVMWELKHGCGFHESAITLDPAMDVEAAKRVVDEQLTALHECNGRIKLTETQIQRVRKHQDNEESEVVVSYIAFTLEQPWS